MHVGSPVEVALKGFGGAPARVMASSASEDDAYVLLDVNATGCRSLYGVNCHRRDGVWEEGNTGKGLDGHDEAWMRPDARWHSGVRSSRTQIELASRSIVTE